MSHNVVPMNLTTPPAAAISQTKESITVPVYNNSGNMSPQHGLTTSTATGLVTSPPSASVPRPVKPSLKQNPTLVPGGKGVRNTSSTNDHIQWDEHAIEEHDLLRGTRMKVRINYVCTTNNSLVQCNERYSIAVWLGCCNRHFAISSFTHSKKMFIRMNHLKQ